MTTFTKIAWRNIRRNRARSTITIAAVSVGLCALIFLKGFVDGADRQMVENYTDLLIGHIQVHKAGFHENMDLEKTIINSHVLSQSFKKIPGIKSFSNRVKDYALISSTDGSAGVLLMGVDPETEKRVSVIHKRVRRGSFLGKDDHTKVIIGTTLAKNLKVDVGDKAVLMSQASDGSMAASAFEVGGIVETGAEEIDKQLALITLKAAQDLLVLGSKVSEIVIKTHSLESIDGIARQLKQKATSKRFEVLTWKDVSPMTYQWMQFDQAFTHLILIIVLIIVASGILNTVLMGVLERIREFGIMLALGTKPNQVTQVVAVESFLLGLMGVIIGGCIGTALVILTGIKGINLSMISSALNSFYIGSVIYPRLDVFSLIFYVTIVLLVSIFVSVYPAKKASQLSPIEAIRHV